VSEGVGGEGSQPGGPGMRRAAALLGSEGVSE
jgi:hypothetical protein